MRPTNFQYACRDLQPDHVEIIISDDYNHSVTYLTALWYFWWTWELMQQLNVNGLMYLHLSGTVCVSWPPLAPTLGWERLQPLWFPPSPLRCPHLPSALCPPLLPPPSLRARKWVGLQEAPISGPCPPSSPWARRVLPGATPSPWLTSLSLWTPSNPVSHREGVRVWSIWVHVWGKCVRVWSKCVHVWNKCVRVWSKCVHVWGICVRVCTCEVST